MARTQKSPNPQMQTLLKDLQVAGRSVALWKKVHKDLSRPSRKRSCVNLYKIAKFVREGETVIVPGKVLSVGELVKPVTVAAFNCSSAAREKITKEGGQVLSIKELLIKNPKGQKVRVLA
ncbi:50S ribosomal protein L18e [archaeon]|nr:50S ribosomal protein L18e [archaeon]|tara:strand:- start:114 stop:473 length:360 start_codon:yes stop_codon:yes gene_type:complete